MADTASTSPEPVAKDSLASLAGQVRHASTGTLARLRRTDPTRNAQASLFETERMLQAAEVTAQGEDRQRWALVLHCLALADGRHDTRADAEPGRVLSRLHFSEARLQQLLEADQPLLFALMPRLARRLSVANAAVNWRPLATLLLCAGSSDPQHEERAEAARQRLVHHYLLAEGLRDEPAADDEPAQQDG